VTFHKEREPSTPNYNSPLQLMTSSGCCGTHTWLAVSTSTAAVPRMDPLFLPFLVLAISNNIIRLFIWISKCWLIRESERLQPAVQSSQQPEAECDRSVSSYLRRSSEDGLQASSAIELGAEHNECTRSPSSELPNADLNPLESTPFIATPPSGSIGANETYITKIISAVIGCVGLPRRLYNQCSWRCRDGNVTFGLAGSSLSKLKFPQFDTFLIFLFRCWW
jgi:hypothetical protein